MGEGSSRKGFSLARGLLSITPQSKALFSIALSADAGLLMPACEIPRLSCCFRQPVTSHSLISGSVLVPPRLNKVVFKETGSLFTTFHVVEQVFSVPLIHEDF